jgi:hypothetical protein
MWFKKQNGFPQQLANRIFERMKIVHTIRIISTFYKSFFLLNMVITLVCLLLFWKYGWGIFFQLLMLKTIVLGLSSYFIRMYKKKEFIYYNNLGISETLLWVSTLTFDMVLYFFLLTKIPKLL